jgi:hypothetical protein
MLFRWMLYKVQILLSDIAREQGGEEMTRCEYCDQIMPPNPVHYFDMTTGRSLCRKPLRGERASATNRWRYVTCKKCRQLKK